MIVLAILAVAGVAAAAFFVTKSPSKKKKGDKDSSGEVAEKGDPYRPTAEPSIPPSTKDGKVDPKDVSKGAGRAVKASAKEIDLASSISYAPDSDPYCKDQARLTDMLKQVGYNIDQELRKTASITDAEEEKIGDQLFREMSSMPKFKRGLDTPGMADARRYIAELAVPLLASAQRKGIVYEFHTIDDPTMNAFAIPGGHIFFYRGILEQPRRIENEAQLAGVLAHEINHVDRRHTIAIFEYLKRLGSMSGGAADLGAIVVSMARHPFSTTQEDESDAFAVKFLVAAEYSPKQFVTMWKTWDELDKKRGGAMDPISRELEELLATHSAPSRRACNGMRVAMTSMPPDLDRYYVGTTNYKTKTPRARQQH